MSCPNCGYCPHCGRENNSWKMPVPVPVDHEAQNKVDQINAERLARLMEYLRPQQ